MARFLTSASRVEQLPEKGKYKLIDNELYMDDNETIYLAWRGFRTDNFTWLKSNNWDIRCAHLHDVGCEYHQMVKVNLTEGELWEKSLLHHHKGKVVCENIPLEYLEVVDITGHQVNNLFGRMLRDADCPKTPKHIQKLYRTGVAFNFGWFKSGKENINLDDLYTEV